MDAIEAIRQIREICSKLDPGVVVSCTDFVTGKRRRGHGDMESRKVEFRVTITYDLPKNQE